MRKDAHHSKQNAQFSKNLLKRHELTYYWRYTYVLVYFLQSFLYTVNCPQVLRSYPFK